MILRLLQLVPDNLEIDFFGHRFYAVFASIIIIGGSILCLSVNGLNFGIHFVGGTPIITPSDPLDIAVCITQQE